MVRPSLTFCCFLDFSFPLQLDSHPVFPGPPSWSPDSENKVWRCNRRLVLISCGFVVFELLLKKICIFKFDRILGGFETISSPFTAYCFQICCTIISCLNRTVMEWKVLKRIFAWRFVAFFWVMLYSSKIQKNDNSWWLNRISKYFFTCCFRILMGCLGFLKITFSWLSVSATDANRTLLWLGIKKG